MSNQMSTETSDALDRLPLKVSVPLRGLFRVGSFTEGDITTVLDACELAGGNTQDLLEFAIGMVSMESIGVEIADTVRMAKRLGKPVRLTWSPRRWGEEHDRLAKIVTFNALSAEDYHYDLDRFRRLVPGRFPGYLVPNRRRLAIIGFIQKHCVANYHDSIVRGSCAFACVFHKKVRWTVELRITESGSLTISQIRSNRNISPTPEVAERIYEILGLGNTTDPDNDLRIRGISDAIRAVNRAALFDACGSQGVERVELEHYYDPGLIDPAGLVCHPHEPGDQTLMQYRYDWLNSRVDVIRTTIAAEIKSLLHSKIQEHVDRRFRPGHETIPTAAWLTLDVVKRSCRFRYASRQNPTAVLRTDSTVVFTAGDCRTERNMINRQIARYGSGT